MSDYEMKLMDLDVEQLGIPVSTLLPPPPSVFRESLADANLLCSASP